MEADGILCWSNLAREAHCVDDWAEMAPEEDAGDARAEDGPMWAAGGEPWPSSDLMDRAASLADAAKSTQRLV